MSDELNNKDGGTDLYALKATYKEEGKSKEVYFDFTPERDEIEEFFIRQKINEQLAIARDISSCIEKTNENMNYLLAFPMQSLEIVKYPKLRFKNKYTIKNYFDWCKEANMAHQECLNNNSIKTIKTCVFKNNSETNDSDEMEM